MVIIVGVVMNRLLALDPGIKTGVAIFQDSKLFDCGIIHFVDTQIYTQNMFELTNKVKPTNAIIERPQIYTIANWKGDPNDLIKVAIQVGIFIAACGPFCKVEEVTPHAWKGNRPKDIDTDYTKSLLDINELRALVNNNIKKFEMHHVLDAVGVGLCFLKRR
jgi:hypothetical protein